MATSSNTAMAASTSLGKNIIALPGELRNEIYRHFFEDILARTGPTATTGPLPINRNDIQYAAANTFEEIVSLFLTSRQISTEARSLFNGLFFPRRHYLLQSRESIYSFSRMPSRWAQNLHKIHLTAHGIPQGRKIFNPIKIALVKAARANSPCDPTTDRRLELRKPHLGFVRESWNQTTIRRRFSAEMRLNGVPTTLQVYKCDNDRFDVILVGPLGKLDWTMIPLARYIENSAWEQLLARRERLMFFNRSEIPLHQMPTASDRDLPEPYIEEKNAGSKLVTEVAVEILEALGLECPYKEPWDLSFR
ncbi:hypothetical protein Q7P35_004595 [Cladosporium inversicolor]